MLKRDTYKNLNLGNEKFLESISETIKKIKININKKISKENFKIKLNYKYLKKKKKLKKKKNFKKKKKI